MPTIRLSPDEIARMEREGIITLGAAVRLPDEPSNEPKKAELVKASFTLPATWIIPVKTVSEANSSKGMRSKMGRKASQLRAISHAMGGHPACVHYATLLRMGKPIRVKITRLGGRGLDIGNLWNALKAIEDAVALCLGADDGSKLWMIDVGQEPGPLMGVRVELGEA